MSVSISRPKRTYRPKIALLSHRFRRPAASQQLTPKQQRRMAEVIERMQDGRYRMVSEACPCGVKAAQRVIAQVDRYGLPLESVLCMHCGTVRTDPFLDAASLDHFYREIYQELYGRNFDVPRYFVQQRAYGIKIADWMKTQGKSDAQRVLEVGCGAGGALSVFRERGHQVAGCDYDQDLLDYGTVQGVSNLVRGSVVESLGQFGEGAFDVIYLHHVFEHVGSPQEMLGQLQSLLAPSGVLLIVVPELEFIEEYPCPDGDALRFFHIAHKYNFSPEGLTLLAHGAGLAASPITPPAKVTNWSTMPELWMKLQRNTSAQRPQVAPAGKRILHRLRSTEGAFQLRTQQALPKRSRMAAWQQRWAGFAMHLLGRGEAA